MGDTYELYNADGLPFYFTELQLDDELASILENQQCVIENQQAVIEAHNSLIEQNNSLITVNSWTFAVLVILLVYDVFKHFFGGIFNA